MMCVRLIVLLAALALLSLVPLPAGRAAAADRSGTAISDISFQQTPVGNHDDTRVGVQLVVLGVAFGTVFVLGTGVFLLRRKLGLVPPPPTLEGGDRH